MTLRTTQLSLVPATATLPPEALTEARPWLWGQLKAHSEAAGWFHWYGLWEGDGSERAGK